MFIPTLLTHFLPFLDTAPSLPSHSIVPFQLQYFTSDFPSSTTTECLRSSYHGSYGGPENGVHHIFLPSQDCLAESPLSEAEEARGILVHLDGWPAHDGGRIVWVGQAGVQDKTVLQDYEPSALSDEQLENWSKIENPEMLDMLEAFDRFAAKASSFDKPKSRPLQLLNSIFKFKSTPLSQPKYFTSTENSMLIYVPNRFMPIIDTLLPSHLVPVVIPIQPQSLPVASSQSPPSFAYGVDAKLAEHLANITEHLVFDPELDKVVKEIDLDIIRRNVRWLTGEAPSGIESRHSFTSGAIKAAHHIKSSVEATSSAKCTLTPFLQGFAPNVICRFPNSSNSTDNIVLSAHYDSRGSFGSTRAPGGDDDASGSAHLLGIVDALGRTGVEFEKKVTFGWFAGEEQGLLGSHAFAESLSKENATVLLHIQADMLGYHAPGEPLQMALPESIHLPEASYLVGNISHIYSPELLVGTTPACCSDHQSFLAFGFPATQVFERNGWIADPYYHNSGDTSQRVGYDFDQIVSIGKVTMASVLTVAGWHIKA